MMRRWTFAMVVPMALTAAAPAAEPWTVDHGASRLAFVATWEDEEFEGEFKRFDARMLFDAGDLETSGFDVSVDVSSADTNSADRDDAMAEPEWFFSKRYPKATFITSAIRAVGPGRYEAQAVLTIKGVSRSVVLPFTWSVSGNRAKMDGVTLLRRTDFKIGEGEWVSGDTIGLDVKVIVDLSLIRGGHG